jgi:hypothetical protein
MQLISNSRAAIAWHLGWDYADIPEYYYQETIWSKKIVSCEDKYYTASKDKKGKPPVITSNRGSVWPIPWVQEEQIEGWIIWSS